MKRRIAIVLAGALLTGCIVHKLGDTDVAALRDAQVLEASIYNDLDAGVTKTKAKIVYCSDHGVLARSEAAEDAGIACPQ